VLVGPSSPYVVTLGAADRQALETIARRGSAQHRQVLRAQIVLAAADGDRNAVIARRLATTDDTVRKWRGRFCRVEQFSNGTCRRLSP
jgi:Homeodomain-like domain-containing protein